MRRNPKALIIEHEPSWKRELENIFCRENFEVDSASTSKEAFCQLRSNFYDLVTVDIGLPEEASIAWKSIVHHIREYHPVTKTFIVTGDPSLETAMDAINYYPISGYFSKSDFNMEVFQKKLRNISDGCLKTHQSKVVSLGQIEQLCTKFHILAKNLTHRYKNRPTLSIEDEYDVQDLLHALLTIYYEDIRSEEWTPSYCGSAARMDFLLKKEQIAIEVKKTRKDLSDKEIGKQLIEDVTHYKEYQNCKTFVCFVYDPEERIRNAPGLTEDLESLSTKELSVRVFIRPTRE